MDWKTLSAEDAHKIESDSWNAMMAESAYRDIVIGIRHLMANPAHRAELKALLKELLEDDESSE